MQAKTAMRSADAPRGERGVLVCLIAVVLGLGAYLYRQPNGAYTANISDDIAEAAFAALACAAMAVTAVHARAKARLAWTALAVGTGGWAVGQCFTLGYDIADKPVPFPGPSDVGYVLFPLGMIAGVAILAAVMRSSLRAWRGILDGLMIASSLLFIGWATTIGAAVTAPQPTLLAKTLSVYYPGSDAVVATVALFLVSQATPTLRRPFALLGAGLVVMSAADTAYALNSARPDFTVRWLWLDALWPLAFGLMAAAALSYRSSGDVRSARDAGKLFDETLIQSGQFALPYLPVAAAFLTAAIHILATGQIDSTGSALCGAIVVFVIARQLVAIADVQRLSAQVVASTAMLEHQAFHDALTGLANRSLFVDRLEHAVELGRVDHHHVGLLFIDLDDFKRVNDTLGHARGDDLLVAVASRLRTALGPAQTIARLGGDEFAALLEHGGVGADEAARDILAAFEPSFTLSGHRVRVRASIGVAIRTADDTALTATELLRRADVAMYVAKNAGKGTAAFWSADLDEPHALGILTMGHDLAQAVAAGDLQVAYQPIVDMTTGRIVDVEALARWRHDGRGEVSPEEFIALAESTGLLTEVTELVVDRALASAATWRTSLRPDLPVSVNLTPSQIGDPRLVDLIVASLARYELPGSALTLELASASVDDEPGTLSVLAALSELGVRLAVDDFGAGPTSLATISALGIQVLKLSRSAVTSPDGRARQRLVRAILAMAAATNVTVVAEGVESSDAADELIAAGCILGQGFHFARPMVSTQLIAALRKASIPQQTVRGLSVLRGTH